MNTIGHRPNFTPHFKSVEEKSKSVGIPRYQNNTTTAKLVAPLFSSDSFIPPEKEELPSRIIYIESKSRHTMRLRQWAPVGQKFDTLPKEAPIVLMVHSLSGRSSWMTPLVSRLMHQNEAVQASNKLNTPQEPMRFYGLDIEQIGQHPYKKGHIANGKELIQEVTEAVEYLAKEHNRPVVLVGLSLGGLLVTHVAANPPKELAGVVALSPGYMPNTRVVNYKSVLTGVWQGIKRKLSGLDGDIPFSVGEGVEENEGYDLDDRRLSKLQERIIQEKISGEEKVNGLTLSSYVKIMGAMLDMSFRKSKQIKIPFRLYLSDADNVVSTSWAKNQVYDKIKSKDKALVRFKESEHDFNTDPAIDEVAASVYPFVHRQLYNQ